MKTKILIFIGLQVLLLGGIFLFVYLSAPKLEYPVNGEVINEDFVQFKFKNANVILVDDNEEFSSPKMLNVSDSNFVGIGMTPGKYYWKAVGNIESFSREFVIGSKVGLELNKEESTLKNVGNVEINVSEKRSSGISGLVILDVEVEYPVNLTNDTIYRGEQNE
ncbi:MAG: hypothetical protein WCX73_02365 [Candidatus Pacearchaeota archaeon]|jgi:hypothetical protein